jgi:hypothetical protein
VSGPIVLIRTRYVLLVERLEKRAHTRYRRRHDCVAHLPLRGYDVVKGEGDSTEALVKVVEAYACDCDDGETGAEGKDYEEFSEETHLERVDQVDCREEDEEFGYDVEGAYAEPFWPLLWSA